MLEFGLNQVTLSEMPFRAFLDTAARLGCVGIEARNDLGRPVFDGMSADEAGKVVQSHGLRLLGVSQVHPFNRWGDDIARQVRDLVETAVGAGAETISLIPANDCTGVTPEQREANLTHALAQCLPILEDAKITALIEPLGFTRSSLRLKSEAIAAIETVGGQDHFQLVHDTFHHTLADETAFYPAQTGIVHISGVRDATVSLNEVEDAHRVLVDGQDRLSNLAQIAALQEGGYTGVYSFECFAPEVRALANPADALKRSMEFLSSHMHRRAA